MGEIHPIRLVAKKREQGPGYEARWIEDGGQESAPFDLQLPVTEDDATELRWYLEKFHGFLGPGTRVQVQQVEERIEALGRQLFAVCFGGSEGTHVYRNLLDAVKDGRQVLLTLGSNESIFLQQPWELMRDHRGPLVFHDVSIRRQLIGAKPAPSRPMAFGLPLRLLLIVARPSGAHFMDPRNSMAPLLDALELLPAGAVELQFCQPPTLARLDEMVAAARRDKKPFHIVHFDGHGTYLPGKGVGALGFEREDHKVDLVEARRLGDLLARLEIPLVMLEACRSSDLSDSPVIGSLAPALLESGVGSVIAFSHSVHIEASRILVERFYRELATGRTVGQALGEARAALRAKPQRWLHLGPNAATFEKQDWFIPQLYQVGADPVLLAKKGKLGKAKAKSRPDERMFGFPPKPMYRFHGRARDLFELERAFERHRAVLLTGGGGMGKTALAREAAYWWLRTGRFEQAVFVSFERPTTVERVVQELGRAVEGAGFTSRPGAEQRKVALEIFRNQRVLLVWDNFESTLPKFQPGEGGPAVYSEDERSRLRRFYEELSEGQAQGRLLVTCRPAEAALPAIKQRSLGGLDRPDSLYLVHAIADIKNIDLERKGYEREEIEKLLDLLGDQPLALSLVIPHLKSLSPATICGDFANLLDRFKDESADEERNRSLFASLEFSTSRLSEATRMILPYLAWFHGGTFETCFLEFTRVHPKDWSLIRPEMEDTGLLWIVVLDGFTVPFLQFHPTLAYVARWQREKEVEEVAEYCFLQIYAAIAQEAHDCLHGDRVAIGMELMRREEVNYISALERSFRRGDHRLGAQFAEILGNYLRIAARPQEWNRLVDWVQEQSPMGSPLDGVVCARLRENALSLMSRGQQDESVALLQQLVLRLENEGLANGQNLAFELGASYLYLAEIFVDAKDPDRALASSLRAVEYLETLSDAVAQVNFAASLGELANSYLALGRLAEALDAAERSLAMNRQLGHERNIASSLSRVAEILRAQQNWIGAEACYAEALLIARRIGDIDRQGIILQHLGSLNLEKGQVEQALEFYEQAISDFQRSGNSRREMQTCNSIAVAEWGRGRLDVSEAWYLRAQELAEQRRDQYLLGAIALNIGALYRIRAELAADAESCTSWLRRAVLTFGQSLQIWLEINNQVNAASSYYQLGIVHRLLEEFDKAEENAALSLKLSEALGQADVCRDFDSLAKIATARGKSTAAAEWAAKRDAKLAELDELRRGSESIS